MDGESERHLRWALRRLFVVTLGCIFSWHMLSTPYSTHEDMSTGTTSRRLSASLEPLGSGSGRGLGNSNTNRRLTSKTTNDESKLRILYIVTSSQTRYYQGKGNKDRLNDFAFPVILDAVESLSEDYCVDLYLVLSYVMDPSKEETLRQALPPSVGLQIWTEGAPYKYICDFYGTHLCFSRGTNGRRRGPWASADNAVLFQGRAQLARQHRYVVKDKFPHYDYFMAFEDDMRVTKDHFEQHRKVMAELRILRELAPTKSTTSPNNATGDFWGALTKDQIEHMRPGFLRVEVLKNPNIKIPYNEDLMTIPVDFSFIRKNDNGTNEGHIDPAPCCHPRHVGLQGKLAPQFPNSSDLIMWETKAEAMSVRKMPESSSTTLDWVMFLPLPSHLKNLITPHFWAGDAAKKKVERPAARVRGLIAQSAGWIASRQEILDLNRMCRTGFLPPFQDNRDGLDNDVEFWSGGLQMSSAVCNIQRIIPLNDPDAFSRHLLYHTANNKQLQDNLAKKLVRMDDFMGQMNTARKAAQQRMEKVH
jgi:hypothetical protein